MTAHINCKAWHYLLIDAELKPHLTQKAVIVPKCERLFSVATSTKAAAAEQPLQRLISWLLLIENK